MSSSPVTQKPHAVCIPFPAQGHISPMLTLAKLLYHKGFYIIFVNTNFNHNRLLKSRGPNSLKGLPDFIFETIQDGLPPTDINATQDIPSLCKSTSKNCIGPFRDLISKLNHSGSSPAVTCIVSDGCMSFTLEAAEELGIPEVLLWIPSSCGFMAMLHLRQMVENGVTPLSLTDESYLTNGYLDTPINSIPGMRDIRLRDLPRSARTTDANDIILNFAIQETGRSSKASAIIINSYYALESKGLDAMKPLLPPIYTIGPLQLLIQKISDDGLKSLGSNLWKEDEECLKWLDSKQPNSVVYVNFGSITVMSAKQLIEFAWGLANSKRHFLWVIRSDLVRGEKAILPAEFTTETKERSLISSWCPQEQVLRHPSIGGFLTHSGWNSTLDTLCGGIPVICWPFFGDQMTNCRYSCTHWGIGMEIDNNVKRDQIESLVREMMEGEKGKEMKKNVMEWKMIAEESTKPGGSSFVNLDKLVNEVLLSSPKEINCLSWFPDIVANSMFHFAIRLLFIQLLPMNIFSSIEKL